MNLTRCFVIQPFDGGKFDKRFEDIFRPAIERAGLKAYRVDLDPSASIPIEAIENGINSATACFAEITTDNPNVWYELGFAFALGKPIVMACSDERSSQKFPFDIQHRTVTTYKVDSTQDFELLKTRITDRLTALITKANTLNAIGADNRLSNIEGLSQAELIVLAATAGNCVDPTAAIAAYMVRNDVEQAGFTPVAFSIGMRRLTTKGLITVSTETDWNDNECSFLSITDRGWSWIEDNEDKFVLKVQSKPSQDRDVPF